MTRREQDFPEWQKRRRGDLQDLLEYIEKHGSDHFFYETGPCVNYERRQISLRQLDKMLEETISEECNLAYTLSLIAWMHCPRHKRWIADEHREGVNFENDIFFMRKPLEYEEECGCYDDHRRAYPNPYCPDCMHVPHFWYKPTDLKVWVSHNKGSVLYHADLYVNRGPVLGYYCKGHTGEGQPYYHEYGSDENPHIGAAELYDMFMACSGVGKLK